MEDNQVNLTESSDMIPEKPDYEQELIALITGDCSDEELKERLSDYHENDIADVLESLTPQERKRLYRVLGAETVSEIFTFLEDVGTYIEELNDDKAVEILEEMDASDALDVLSELDDDKRDELFNRITEEQRHDIELIYSYDDNEIGSRMTTNFISIHHDLTIKQAMKALVEQAGDNDNISTIYVTDKDDTFFGAIDLKDLIVARQYDELDSLITTSYPYVYAKETISECMDALTDYSEDSIPVLDNDKKLLGVITAQDIVEVVGDELGEDYAKLAGLTEEEDLKEPLRASIKKRLPWLITLLFLGLIVSTVAGLFEQVVAQLTLVVCFQSLILGMAGNVGTQSLAVTIRVLMDEELVGREKFHLVFKEMRVGLVNGFFLGILSLSFIGLYIYLAKGKSPLFSFAVSACIGLAMWTAMTISSMMGTIIPIFFHKIKVDPAVASGPLISTINDLVAVVTYYGLTWILLINLLKLVE